MIRKTATLEKLDRSRIIGFYLTPRQHALYIEDEYKYLVHLFRLYSTDEFHILQYLLLKFHPLILSICFKYSKRQVSMDWRELVSFARSIFAELVMRFDLNDTLYFRTYLRLALDRALSDRFLFEDRRKSLTSAIRLDVAEEHERDAYMMQHATFTNVETENTNVTGLMEDSLVLIEASPDLTPMAKWVFVQTFVQDKTLQEIASMIGLTIEATRRHLTIVVNFLRDKAADGKL